jgi:predicted dehydrogenase
VAGIVEPFESKRVEVAERYGVSESFASLAEGLAAGWDAAVLATPAPLHIPMARECADQRVPFLVEKPLSTEETGIAELLEKVRAEDLVAGVAFVYRSHPGSEWLKEKLESGQFGEPVELVLVSGQNFPFYRPAYRDIYYRDRAAGGGAIQDVMPHLFNLAEWLVGPITAVGADAAHQILEGVEVEDTVHCLTRHGNILGNFSLNQHQAPNETTMTIVCERGTLRFELIGNRCLWATEPGSEWQVHQFPPMERDDWFRRQEEYFLDSLDGLRPPKCTLEEGWHTLKVTLLALSQYDRGGMLEPVPAPSTVGKALS